MREKKEYYSKSEKLMLVWISKIGNRASELRALHMSNK